MGFCLHSLHSPYTPYTLPTLPLQLLCITWDAKRICRLSLIFRYLLRPEMMVIYTYNIIYGFLAKNSKPPRGGYTQDTQFSKSRSTLESKTPPHDNPSQSTKSRNITPNLRTARPPPLTPFNPSQSRHITAFPLNPF